MNISSSYVYQNIMFAAEPHWNYCHLFSKAVYNYNSCIRKIREKLSCIGIFLADFVLNIRRSLVETVNVCVSGSHIIGQICFKLQYCLHHFIYIHVIYLFLKSCILHLASWRQRSVKKLTNFRKFITSKF